MLYCKVVVTFDSSLQSSKQISPEEKVIHNPTLVLTRKDTYIGKIEVI